MAATVLVLYACALFVFVFGARALINRDLVGLFLVGVFALCYVRLLAAMLF
jgi:hypothetical protein